MRGCLGNGWPCFNSGSDSESAARLRDFSALASSPLELATMIGEVQRFSIEHKSKVNRLSSSGVMLK
jgi:hypothetical protein